MNIDVEIRGLEELQQKHAQMARDLKGEPMMNAMRDATLIVHRAAVKNLHPWKGPGTGGVDTGRMRASIQPNVHEERSGIVGTVGSNVEYAKYQELGTKPHWVGIKHIGTWAERHLGVRKPVFVSGVALRFLARAVEDNADRIFHKIGDGVAKIASK